MYEVITIEEFLAKFPGADVAKVAENMDEDGVINVEGYLYKIINRYEDAEPICIQTELFTTK